ncbi:MAG: hypothetical protein JWQ21_670 [Herminiimonas sp.]|nr:hypothetical protein [Herminiimonas sp.]
MEIPQTIPVSERLNAQFRVAQRIAHIGSWERRISDNVLIWSDETYRIFGTTPETFDLSADAFFSFVHPEDMQSLRLAQEKTLTQNLPLDIEYRIVRPDGEVRHVHERAELHLDETDVQILTGTVHDITDRIQSEQKLQRSESLLRFASAIIRMGAWDVELPDHRVVWSDEVCDIYEVARGTMPTIEEALNFYTPQSRERIEKLFAECVNHGTPYDEELQIVTAKGRHLWVRTMGQAMQGEDGAIRRVRGAIQDITTRKQSKEDALRIAARLTTTLESITDAFFTLDPDWRFTYINAEAERLLGRSRGELLGKGIWDEFKEAVESASYRQYHRARQENSTVSFEEFYPPLGLWLEVRAFPSEEGLAVYFRNVTERRLAQEAIREGEERFKIVAKATADTVWDWDFKTDNIWWNESIFTLFGFTPEELEPDSASWTNRIHPSDKDRVLHGIHKVIDGDQEKWSDQYLFLRKDGSYAYVLDRGYVIRNAEGEAIRMVGSMTDLTAQKQSEMELARLNRALLLRGACDELINRVTDEKELLASICRLALTMGGYRLAWIGYAQNDERRSIKIEALSGEKEDIEYVDGLQLSWSENDPMGLGLGPAGQTIRTGVPRAIDDITLIPRFSPWLKAAQNRGFRGVINLPLRHQDRIFGLMALYAHGALVASADEMKLLQEMADNLASGIENIRAREEKQLIQSAVSKVAASVSASAGAEFFEQLAMNMAEAVGAQASFVARLLPDQPVTARTLAAVVDNEVSNNFDYKLEGTPCENLLQAVECIVPDSVAERFPSPSLLAAQGAQAYAGRRLDNSAGRPIGVLFVLFRHSIKQFDLITSTLQIFASRAAAELERQESDARMREQAALLDKAKDAIVVKGMDNRLRFWNKGAERLYGWTAEEAIGQSVEELLFEDPGQLRQATDILLQHGRWSGETRERHKDGSTLIIENQWTLVSDDHEAPHSIFVIKSDITQRKAAENEIHSLAFYDPLTSLPNRRLLVERLTARLTTGAPTGHNGALLFVDLDHFKTLNDTFGHDQGDELLRQVAQRIQSCVRESDTVARLGGDEFVIMLEKLAEESQDAAAQATLVGEKILAAFNHSFQIAQSEFYSTPSIGISLFDDKKSANELLKRADLAMYQAKAAGRNTMRFFDPEMQAVVATKVAMQAELRQGLQRKELFLHFQPQVDAEGHVTGAEALVRWLHPKRGIVSPAEFIPLAEETGLILPLGAWVMRSACTQLATWAGCPELATLTLSVNVSARQFRHPAFVEQMLTILMETRADPSKLKLELTESLLLENVEDIIDKMTVLKAKGIGFSLDDFGTGYSSLMYLKRLPLDQLKIDQSFVRDVFIDPNDAAIARTIIALGQSLGLAVIAEGVETEEQRDFLASHGCHAYQGYLFSRPLTAPEFDAFVFSRLGLVKKNIT